MPTKKKARPRIAKKIERGLRQAVEFTGSKAYTAQRKLLRTIARLELAKTVFIRAKSDRVDMGRFGMDNTCGTTACLLGHCGLSKEFHKLGLKMTITRGAEYDSGQFHLRTTGKSWVQYSNAFWAGKEFFGITLSESHSAFAPCNGTVRGSEAQMAALKNLQNLIDTYQTKLKRMQGRSKHRIVPGNFAA